MEAWLARAPKRLAREYVERISPGAAETYPRPSETRSRRAGHAGPAAVTCYVM